MAARMLAVVAGFLLAVAAGGWSSQAREQDSPVASYFSCTLLPLDTAGVDCLLSLVPAMALDVGPATAP